MAAAVVGGTVLALGADAWPLAWMGLEMNLLGFVPVAMSTVERKKSAMTYFVVQSVGSLLLLFGGITAAALVLVSAGGVLLKMGLAPLHYWVPPVAARLGTVGLSVLLTWQKLAPLSLLLYVSCNLQPIVLANLALGSVMMVTASSMCPLLIFSGLVQMAWVLSIGGAALMWHYVGLYFASLLAIVGYQRRRTTTLALALLNAGGLPPMTVFMMKLRVLQAMKASWAALLLAGSGAALASYTRFVLACRLRWEAPPIPLLAAIWLGSV